MLQPGLLTTEKLRKEFKNNFDLCNFAITIGRNRILEGALGSLGEVLQAVYELAKVREK